MLTRLHSAEFEVTDFNPTVAEDAIQGGRFDGTPEDEYSFLYAASDDATAVSELLLRDIPSDDRGVRVLLTTRLQGLRIGWLRTSQELQLVSLRSGTDLAAIGQDPWLTTASADEYEMTRLWGAAIRGSAPWAHGLTWRSRREPEGFAYILFGDRCPEAFLEEAVRGTPLQLTERNLESGFGGLYLDEILSRYRVTLM